MSNVYPKFREQLMSWALNANAPAGLAFYMIAVNDGYVYGAGHTSLADVSVGNISVSEKALANVTFLNGVIKADNVSLSGLDTEAVFDAIIVYLKSGVGDTYLACYLDNSSDGSIPANIDAAAGIVSWAANGIFKV